MEFHRGRLIDHVHLVVADLERSKHFYRAVLDALGRGLSGEGHRFFFADELFAAFILDPDGNNIEAVFHGPTRRTAESIVIMPAP